MIRWANLGNNLVVVDTSGQLIQAQAMPSKSAPPHSVNFLKFIPLDLPKDFEETDLGPRSRGVGADVFMVQSRSN